MITASRLNLESQALNMAHQAAMNPNAPAAGDAGGFGGGGGAPLQPPSFVLYPKTHIPRKTKTVGIPFQSRLGFLVF